MFKVGVNAGHIQSITMPDLRYRPDIDGLRALAVFSVLIFHAFPKRLSGGFVGVDIFFVISGFLISGIIFGQVEGNSFSLRDFYSRRVRRIFPALILVMLSSVLIGWCMFFPDEYQRLGAHVFAGTGFFSNIQFWSEAGYFDQNAYTKPLLHLWSLSIEEQFYLFWPVMLYLSWSKIRNQWNFSWVFIFGFISFAWSIYSSKYSPDGAFYLPISRMWELMAGGLVA